MTKTPRFLSEIHERVGFRKDYMQAGLEKGVS